MQRNLHATLMYQHHPLPIYLSGGIRPGSDKTYAKQNSVFLNKMGVPSDAMTIVEKGRDTQSEAQALSELLKGKNIALVTSASHMQRAKGYFEMYGVDVIPIPVDHLSDVNIKTQFSLPNSASLHRSEIAIHEYLGLTYQTIFVTK
jgi:uncharacterized SAM-binding protein YcdF (DUF218 family)